MHGVIPHLSGHNLIRNQALPRGTGKGPFRPVPLPGDLP